MGTHTPARPRHRPARRTGLRHAARGLMRLTAPGCMALWGLGALLRCTVRDHWLALAYPYYVLNPPVLTLLAAVAAFAWYRRRRALPAACGLFLTAASIGWTLRTQWQHGAAAPVVDTPPLKVLFWNTARGFTGWERLAAGVRAADADVVGLVEAGQNPEGMLDRWRELLPEYEVVLSYAGILVAARGDLQKIHSSTCAPWGRHVLTRVNARGQELYVVVFDVAHTIAQPRSVALAPLYEVLAEIAGQPVVVLGDFNTPPDSVHFEPLRRTFRNAFETAGRGYAPTWPVIAPFLALDQAWVSPHVVLHRVTAGWSWKSDHRPLLLELSVPAALPHTPGAGAPPSR